jgi:hypothetical protein
VEERTAVLAISLPDCSCAPLHSLVTSKPSHPRLIFLLPTSGLHVQQVSSQVSPFRPEIALSGRRPRNSSKDSKIWWPMEQQLYSRTRQ